MDKKDAIVRIYHASETLQGEYEEDAWGIWLLVQHILSHRLSKTQLEKWASELEKLVKRTLEAGASG